MRFRSLVGALFLALAVSSPARADVIVIDPNAFALGTDLSNLFVGVSMSSVTQGASGSWYNPVRSGVFAGQHYYGDAVGSQTMGGGYIVSDWVTCYEASRSGHASGACGGWGSVLELTFTAPTDFVQINAAWLSDGPGMQAYDSLGNEIARCWSTFGGPGGGCASSLLSPSPDGHLTSLTINRDHRDIARIVFGGVTGNSQATEVSYGVPEPTTLGFMAMGLAGAIAARRRRTA